MTKKPPSARTNPARARRSVYGPMRLADPEAEPDHGWTEEPARLTEGHFDLGIVQDALTVASDAPEKGVFLGRGNFGETYAVPVCGGVAVVKIPTEKDIHGRTWKLPEQRANFLHEAGVANELEALGSEIVPRTVYVEMAGGRPALVREYGEPVRSMSVEEFSELEQALADVEALGWRVEDEISLYRRPDGSVFVGDVGIWHPVAVYASGKRDVGFDDSSLDYLTPRLAEQVLGAPYGSMPSLFSIQRATRWAAEELEERPTRPLTGFQQHHLDLVLGGLREKVARRQALGLPVPIDALAVLQAATELGL